jgi:hypothetical protein
MSRRIVRTAMTALALAIATVVVAPNPAGATTFLPLTTENMADVSTMIVEGQVQEVWTELDELGYVWTRARVKVSDVWKGHRVPDEIVISSIGGSVGNYTTHVEGQAVFSVGEDMVVFLHRDANDRLVPLGKFLGKMTVRRANGEERQHVMRWHPRPEWKFDHRFLPHPEPEDRVYLDDFEALVRGHLAKPWTGQEIPGVSAELLQRVNTPEIRSAR